MLDVDSSSPVRLIGDRVGLLLGLVIVSMEDSVNHSDLKRRFAIRFRPSGDKSAQIQCERDESLLPRLESLHQRFAGIGVPIDHRQRTPFERQR